MQVVVAVARHRLVQLEVAPLLKKGLACALAPPAGELFGAQQRGWSVVIPDTNGPVTPHRHMQQLWQQLLRPSPFTRLLMVGHSYGGPVAMSLLKSEPEACGRLGAVVTTDGMAWAAAGWDTIEQIDESVPTDEQVAPPQATEHARAHATHTSAS